MEYVHNILCLRSGYGTFGRTRGRNLDNGINQLPRLLETGCSGPEETVVRDLASTAEKWIDVFRNDIRCQFTRKRE